MRVLELITGLGAGGAEGQLVLLAQGLRALGCEVEVACLKDAGGPAGQALAAAGVAVHALRGRVPLDPRPALRLDRLLARGRFAVVHSHLGRPDVLASEACARRGLPHLITRHSDFEPWSGAPLLWPAYRRALGRAAAIFAVSETVRRALLAWGAPETHVERVPGALPPLDWDAVAPPQVPARRIGFAGRFDRVKGIDLFCAMGRELLMRRPELELSAAGSGPLERGLRRGCERRGVPVRWRGWVADRAALYGAMDVLVVPSRREGLGLAAAEALAAGRRVVACAAGGLIELLDGREDAALVGLRARDADTAAALADAVIGQLDREAGARRATSVHGEIAPWAGQHVAAMRRVAGR